MRKKHKDIIKNLAKEHFNLQSALIATLPPQQDLVHEKTLADWESLLASSHHRVLALRNESGELIAHAVAILPDEQNPDADMLDMELPDKPSKVTTLSAIMAHPDHKGHHAMLKLIQDWIELAIRLERPHLLGLVTTTNFMSWTQFLKADMAVTGGGFDPSDNSTCFYLHRNLNEKPSARQAFAAKTQDSLALDPHVPLEEIKKLCEEGYIGHSAEKGSDGRYTGRLIMSR